MADGEVMNGMAKGKKKRDVQAMSERELHERRRYGFFWYDWIWKLLRPVMVFVTSFVIVCGLVYTLTQALKDQFLAPVDSQSTETVVFPVESGSSLSTVAQNLEEAGLIRNHTVFKYMADFMGMGQRIQSGRYTFSKAMSSTEIIANLVAGDGRPRTRDITIIPGWTVEDIAAYLKQCELIASEEDFLSLCRTGEAYSGFGFIGEVLGGSKAKGRKYVLEGYLSPNTYEVYTDTTADAIVRKLLSQTEAAYLSSYDERAQTIGMTMDEVFTLASMIEKEAKTADFAKVSAVFHNRLRENMTLDSDVTVKYASGSQKMYLTDTDLAVQSPYNTYKSKGLPVGPVCNPSMDAVVAALYPDEQFVAQKYLYFCSTDPDSGELHFSRTLEEHNAASAMYRPLWEEYDRKRGLN